jgi:hypothetical protein
MTVASVMTVVLDIPAESSTETHLERRSRLAETRAS